MQYYQELLESFDKLKKRKFKLTIMEQGGNAEAQAQAALEAAKGGTHDTPVEIGATKNGSPIRGYVSSEGAVLVVAPWPRGGVRQKRVIDAPPPNGTGQVIPDVWKEFLTFFSGDEEAAPVEGEEQEVFGGGAAPGDTIRTMLESGSQKIRDRLGDWFLGMNRLSGNLFDKLGPHKDILGTIPGGSAEGFAGSFTGAAGRSVERQLVNSKRVVRDEEGRLTRLGAMDPVDLEVGASRLHKLLSKASLNKISESEALELRSHMAFNEDGSVFLRTGGHNEGLLFKDNGRAITAAMRLAEGRGNFKFDVLPLKAATAGISSWRGKNLERVSTIRMLAKKCIGAREMGMEVEGGAQPVACAALQREVGEFVGEAHKWREAHQWARGFELGDSAIRAEDQEILRSIQSTGIQGEGIADMVRGIFQLSKESDDLLDADMIVPVGAITGGGRRADVNAIWVDDEKCGKARDGLLRKGFSEEDIDNNQMIRRMSAKEAFENSTALRDDFLAVEGLRDANSKVCVHGTGLKHYEHGLGNPKIGELEFNKVDEVLGGAIDASEPHWAEMREHTYSELGMDEVAQQAMLGVHKSIKDIDDRVRDLPANATVSDEEGGILTTNHNALQNFAKRTLDDILDNTTVGELFPKGTNEDDSRSELYSQLNTLMGKQGGETTLDTPEGEERARELISRFLRQRYTMKRVAQENDGERSGGAATDYLAVNTFLTGGSINNGDSGDFRSIADGELKYFRHNEVLEVVKAFRNGRSYRGMTVSIPNTNSFTTKLVLDGNKDTYVSFGAEGQSSETVDGGFSRNTRFVTHASGGLLNEIATPKSRSASVPEEVNADAHDPINNVIEEYLENQRDILYKILEAR